MGGNSTATSLAAHHLDRRIIGSGGRRFRRRASGGFGGPLVLTHGADRSPPETAKLSPYTAGAGHLRRSHRRGAPPTTLVHRPTALSSTATLHTVPTPPPTPST